MVGGHGEGGSEDSESRVRTMNIFIPVKFFILSQGTCESRDLIYDERVNSG